MSANSDFARKKQDLDNLTRKGRMRESTKSFLVSLCSACVKCVSISLCLFPWTQSGCFWLRLRSAYGESVFLITQTWLIAFLVCHFSGRATLGVAYTGAVAAGLTFLMSPLAPRQLLVFLQSTVMVNVAAARVSRASLYALEASCAASLHRSMGVVSLKSMGAPSLHTSMGAASLHRSRVCVPGLVNGCCIPAQCVLLSCLSLEKGTGSCKVNGCAAYLHLSMSVLFLHK